MARSIPRLVRRGNVFYFRAAVPRGLARMLGRVEIKLSLRTCDARTSLLWGRVLSNAVDRLFEELSRMPMTSTDILNERARAYFQACLNKALETAYFLPTDPMIDVGFEVDSLRQSHKELIAAADNPEVLAISAAGGARSPRPEPLNAPPER
jgi:hypothetical protein